VAVARTPKTLDARPSWTTIDVQFGSRPELTHEEKLGLLIRWLRGEAPPEARFVESSTGRVLADPLEVN
jgi:hypothetical protein